ncbi:MAG: hypothetical protein KBS56_05715 [Clostridiales bacterium]|nr:hypothetical protein [Candidatus Crickella equi]
MKQMVDVLVAFDIGRRDPRPIKFKFIESGKKLTVNVYSELSREYIGMNRIDYECNSLSSRGNLIVYKLSYYRNEGRWEIEM